MLPGCPFNQDTTFGFSVILNETSLLNVCACERARGGWRNEGGGAER